MKKTLFVSALAGVMSLGLVGCSDDKEGVDGASSAEEAFEILCEDFLVGWSVLFCRQCSILFRNRHRRI